MVTGCWRLALGGGGVLTLPALIAPDPVFVPAAVRMGAAAASLAGSVIARPRLDAPLTVGRMRKLSPAAGAVAGGAVDTLSVTPSTVFGSAAGAKLVAVLSDSRVKVYWAPSN